MILGWFKHIYIYCALYCIKKKKLFIWPCQVLVVARGIWFPLHREYRVLGTGPPGKSLSCISNLTLLLIWQKVPVSGPESGDPWDKGPGNKVNTWNKLGIRQGLRLLTWHTTQWVYRSSGMQVDSGKIIPFFQEKPKMQIFMWNFPIFNTLKKAKQNMSAD